MQIKDLPDGINTLIIDLGGVLLNIDYQASKHAFESLGVKDFDGHFSQMAQSHLFDRLETGKISTVDFLEEIRKEGEIDANDMAITSAWNAMLLDFPLERMRVLEALSEKFNLFLFSNTNAIHIEAFHAYMKDIDLYDRFDKVFSKIYYSYSFGHRKPHPESFSLLLEKEELRAEQCFFVDDSPQHIVGAKTAGIASRLITKGIESMLL